MQVAMQGSVERLIPLPAAIEVTVPAPPAQAAWDAAVIKPLALTVNVGQFVVEPNEPTLLFTVARVVATVPTEVVISPVSAGIRAAGTVPLPRFVAFKLVRFTPLRAGKVAGKGGAASDRIKVVATPLTADAPIVAVGFAGVPPPPDPQAADVISGCILSTKIAH